jgi:hypothetical protein
MNRRMVVLQRGRGACTFMVGVCLFVLSCVVVVVAEIYEHNYDRRRY